MYTKFLAIFEYSLAPISDRASTLARADSFQVRAIVGDFSPKSGSPRKLLFQWLHPQTIKPPALWRRIDPGSSTWLHERADVQEGSCKKVNPDIGRAL
jgi:hypothetical protein